MVTRTGYPISCPCGSGKASSWKYDAQGIALARTCTTCHDAKMAKFRPEILTGYNQSHVDEPIEED